MADETTARAQATREARLRRAAQRQGCKLVKSRRRDPRALDYGAWTIFVGPPDGDVWKDALEYRSLDDVERYLGGERVRTRRNA
jgi:hypothetical protein